MELAELAVCIAEFCFPVITNHAFLMLKLVCCEKETTQVQTIRLPMQNRVNTATGMKLNIFITKIKYGINEG